MHEAVAYVGHEAEVLDKLRGICLAYPEAHEVEQFGHPWFKAGKRPFAVFGGEPGAAAIGFSTSHGDQEALCAMDPQRFFPTPYMHHHGWTSMRVRPDMPWDLVEEVTQTAYRHVALARMLKAMEG